jgi:hypothetical protein
MPAAEKPRDDSIGRLFESISAIFASAATQSVTQKPTPLIIKGLLRHRR